LSKYRAVGMVGLYSLLSAGSFTTAFEMLEPCEAKVSRTVLRGGSGNNAPPLLGGVITSAVVSSPEKDIDAVSGSEYGLGTSRLLFGSGI
jgi:hypothetical protein